MGARYWLSSELEGAVEIPWKCFYTTSKDAASVMGQTMGNEMELANFTPEDKEERWQERVKPFDPQTTKNMASAFCGMIPEKGEGVYLPVPGKRSRTT
ncbi:hypothetical protein AVEN_42149-1 [Araneus ventricosus]|uniref:Uncharacterized protein n=1 Tax=Araneus ventricosus TaxID=182803 RepID=A0A4Y2D3L3_ARAVE|nr:hypothetical protein AVEN_42149-1 [Araneus ventricosus]